MWCCGVVSQPSANPHRRVPLQQPLAHHHHCAPPSPPRPQFGYFSRALEEECEARGVALGADSEVMVRVADTLPEDKLQALCEVQVRTGESWSGGRVSGSGTGLRGCRVAARRLRVGARWLPGSPCATAATGRAGTSELPRPSA